MNSRAKLVKAEVVDATSQPNQTFGDQARQIADRLRAETELQVKLTSRILGAAAQIANNHDRLIDEVVDMVEEELAQQEMQSRSVDAVVTVAQLKKRFKTLKDARVYFGVKAVSWAVLVQKLNASLNEKQQLPDSSQSQLPQDPQLQESLPPSGDRLAVLEQEVKSLHAKVDRLLALVSR